MKQGIRNSDFITKFTEFLTGATSEHNNIFILGDFNIHINDLENADSCLLLDTITAFNLKHQVDIPTHNPGHTLDLIIMENSEEDHWFITMQLTECKCKVQQLFTKYKKIPDNIVQEFHKHFNNQPVLKATNLDETIIQLRCEMQRTLDQIALEKTKKRTTENRKKKPWLDNELYDQRRIIKNRERVWLKY